MDGLSGYLWQVRLLKAGWISSFFATVKLSTILAFICLVLSLASIVTATPGDPVVFALLTAVVTLRERGLLLGESDRSFFRGRTARFAIIICILGGAFALPYALVTTRHARK